MRRTRCCVHNKLPLVLSLIEDSWHTGLIRCLNPEGCCSSGAHRDGEGTGRQVVSALKGGWQTSD